ncbi:MAG: P-II family nitrogen regulator [Candidatus Methanomethylophilaceae archaeon]|nr:P-II family nitrogen regulator [Candidatus Methanomethylophilaceae archaeon]MDD3379354.1 P-II family nitrogen regulator [Candidatus Methanomethylophilaceae archaeon]MDY0224623.1 P-II family nitrogen regulator [Candidatus Methanomethylophilaceae archaeon]
MKMIIAIVRPEKCQAVKDALKAKGVNGMTITHVVGRGTQAGIKFTNRIGDFLVDEIEKIKIEVVIEDDSNEECVIKTITDTANTGKPGDGRIIVVPVEKFLQIRS